MAPGRSLTGRTMADKPRPRLRVLAGWVAVAGAVAAAGCGNVTPYASDGGAGTGGQASGSGGASSSGGAAGGNIGSGGAVASDGGGGGGSDGGNAARCPSKEPTTGAICLREGAACEFGDDPRGDMCRAFASCSGQHWTVTKPDPTTCPPFTDAGMCPMMPAGTVCTAHDSFCSLPDGRSCHCSNCVDGPVVNCTMEWLWRCQGINNATGCPAAAPNIGTGCLGDATCSYGCRMMNRRCDHGVWVGEGEGPCPVSTRRAKQDIRYLAPADIHQLAEEILNVRLATYAYRDELRLGGRRHLGFVIEDSPEIPAVDRDHDMVDLYGYTSMLLAATQQQRREIDDLKLQLGALKAEIAGLRRRHSR
jgi:Chaperone of endosialidase